MRSSSPASGRRSRARDNQREQRRDDAPGRRPAGTRKTSILLATRVVQPASSLASGSAGGSAACSLSPRSASSTAAVSHPGCLPGASNVARRIASRAVEPCFQSRCPPRRASHSHSHRLPARCERHRCRTTSTGPLGVWTLIGSERLATARPATSQRSFQTCSERKPRQHRVPDGEHCHFLILSPAPDESTTQSGRRVRGSQSGAGHARAPTARAVVSTGSALLNMLATTTSPASTPSVRTRANALQRSRRQAPARASFLTACPQYVPKDHFRSLKSAHLQGES